MFMNGFDLQLYNTEMLYLWLMVYKTYKLRSLNGFLQLTFETNFISGEGFTGQFKQQNTTETRREKWLIFSPTFISQM